MLKVGSIENSRLFVLDILLETWSMSHGSSMIEHLGISRFILYPEFAKITIISEHTKMTEVCFGIA